jgi:hypothetical protein
MPATCSTRQILLYTQQSEKHIFKFPEIKLVAETIQLYLLAVLFIRVFGTDFDATSRLRCILMFLDSDL